MSGGREEYRNTTLTEMVGASRSIYYRDKSGETSSGYGGGDGDRGIGGRERVGYRRMEGGRMKLL